MEFEAYAALAHEEDHHWWFEGRRRIVRDLLHTHLKPRATRRILDVGCGTGGMFPLLSSFGHTEGADGSPEAIAYATQRFPGFTVHHVSLPERLPDSEWDVITAFDVIEHLDDPVACLRTMREHLVDDGQIVITVPAYALLWSEHDVVHHHKRRYRRAMLAEQLADAGLRPTYMTHFNTWLLPPIAAVRIASRLLPARRDRSAGAGAGTPAGAGNLQRTPGLLNRLLISLFASERGALRLAPLPAGVSIFAIAERA
jgi:2-polyprenyl-3-methyl-5-hydroxy-6-metoxy-1,4-benzoquinol methylase